MSNSQALNDAENGVAENVFPVSLPPPHPMSGDTTRVNSSTDLKAALELPPPLPLDEKAVLADEKKTEMAVPPVKKDVPRPAASKAKWKRASRWTRFKLWYNTYRYAYSAALINTAC